MVAWAQQKVQEVYKLANHIGTQNTKWPWKHIQKAKVPHKVACFTWVLANEAFLTLDNAQRGEYLYAIDVLDVERMQRQ